MLRVVVGGIFQKCHYCPHAAFKIPPIRCSRSSVQFTLEGKRPLTFCQFSSLIQLAASVQERGEGHSWQGLAQLYCSSTPSDSPPSTEPLFRAGLNLQRSHDLTPGIAHGSIRKQHLFLLTGFPASFQIHANFPCSFIFSPLPVISLFLPL